MKHPNEAFIELNVHSELLNKSAIAKRLKMNVNVFTDKLKGRGGAKRFTAAELIEIEQIVKTDLNL